MSDLEKLANDLPVSPGVYMWKDSEGKILYIGKSKELRKRVQSYLRLNGLDRRRWEMMQHAEDLETILTNTDREALLLEATLIQKHRPRYNIALKDDRRHAWIKVNLDSEVPTFSVTREVEKDGATYYGPYGSTKRVERFLDTLRKYIPIAMCTGPESVRRECMDYHLGRCVGPCKERVQLDEYRSLVEQMCLYLEGQEEKLIDLLDDKMNQAAKNLEYEKAAEIRDRIHDIQILMRRQRVVEVNGISRDALGIARTEQASLVEMLVVRGGRLIGHDSFYFEIDLETPDTEILTSFIEQFYFTLPQLPEEILLPLDIPDREQYSEWLGENSEEPVRIRVPEEGKEAELIEMANRNAYRDLRKILILGESEEEIVHDGVKELKMALGLRHAPMHIEGFDIANIQGTDPTGSCVVFKNGEPENSRYRMFRIRVKDTPDDYAMMHEVVYRRYRGVLERGNRLPDLILIDGGKGQLNVALRALEELGIDYVPLVSIAKREEILFTKENLDGIALEFDSEGLHLVQQVRDEAHRFAQRYHHKLREKRFTGSILEEAPGIGPKRRAALLYALGSYDAVRKATLAELVAIDGMTEKSAKSLRAWIDTNDPL
ncbi:excinuclease ABC subunit UvrC [Candidatus Thorarchaeota archaeon]|nr:MAG: excinuclease ABC subunit UvrC [Candidatus Thorarchaeota archaeon]